MIRRVLRGSEWRRDVLRTNLWLVPAIEVAAAVLLFIGTLALDRASYDGVFKIPGWAISEYQRLVQRAFEKVRQAGRGMPAVMIRQLDALAKIMERATAADDCAVLLDQAAMIERLSEATVDEESDRNDVRRAYRRVLDVHAGVAATAAAPAT